VASCCRWRSLVALALATSLLTACSLNLSARKQKYVVYGQRYFEKGQYHEAAIEFSKAIYIDPKFVDAHRRLAETYLKMQQPDRALDEFAKVVELQPADYHDRITMSYLLISSRRFPQAQNQTKLLLTQRPSDPAVYSLVSNLLAQQGDIKGAIAEIQKASALAPDEWELYLSLALLQLKADQPSAAEASLNRVVALNPNSMKAHILLGGYDESHNNFDQAEQEFRRAAAIDSSSMEPRAALARLFLAEGKNAAAEDVLVQATHDLPNNPESLMDLSNFYFMTGDAGKAVLEYAVLHQQHQRDMQITKKYIQLLIQTMRYSEARTLIDQILRKAPNDSDALLYQSEVQISQGDTSNAIATLQSVIKGAPDDSEAHYALGVAFAKQGDLARAVNEWQEALRENPESVKAASSIADAEMQQGNIGALQVAAKQLINLQPAAPEGYALLSLAEINLKQLDDAEVNAQKAISVAPQSAFGYVQMGNLRFAQKNYSDASVAYHEALNRNPNSIDALRGLVNVYVAQRQVDNAIAAVDRQIAKSSANAGFYSLLGAVLFHSKNDLDGAEAALEKATALGPRSAVAWMQLCEVQAAKGDMNQAVATVNQSLKLFPHQAGFYILLGNLLESQSNWKEAEAAYQSALTIDFQNPIASSDLARVMLHTGGSLETALSLIQNAHRQLPNSPTVADTLGWVYYQKGMYSLAVTSLQEALRVEERSQIRDNPDIHFHLGMAYERTKQPSLARQQFEDVLKIDPGYRNAATVRAELTRLKS